MLLASPPRLSPAGVSAVSARASCASRCRFERKTPTLYARLRVPLPILRERKGPERCCGRALPPRGSAGSRRCSLLPHSRESSLSAHATSDVTLRCELPDRHQHHL